MLSYVPQFLREARSYKAIIDAQGAELDVINTNLQDVLSQFYVETATWGLALWENMLNIRTITNKPIEERRSNIIAKLRGVGTVNVALIKNLAESYVYGTVNVLEDNANYTFTVKFVDVLGIPTNLDDVKAAIEEIKPAHLNVEYEFTYTTWGEVRSITWGQVKISTWDELKTRMVI